MSIRNRPYVGEWSMNRTLVRHTPDTIVLINGYQEFASCAGCSQSIDINKYITSVSADATTESAATANFSVVIPQHEIERFQINGKNLLQPSLEVVIFMRGYFPMVDFAGFGQDVETNETDDLDPDKVPVYPYYQVFRGVVTSVSHEFSGGFYSATVQCTNLLHFWQYLHLSVNGAVFGKRPAGSLVEPRLDGHRFTSMNPYAIIYTLVKVAFGAAYGVDFQLSRAQNTAAVDDTIGKSQFAHAAEWWAKRWTENSGALRMYGIDGRMFNHDEQAYYGFWMDASSANSGGGTKGYAAAVKRVFVANDNENVWNPGMAKKLRESLRENEYDPLSTQASIVSSQDGSTVKIIDDVVKMQAFVFDISKLGNVNFFETEYMTKMEIAEMVKTITGFEFYQDVDGDLVFKPPMYNLDTRQDPVFVIKDRDLISISETESEPECTFIKGSGSHFANVQGHGVEGWMGVGAVFIDYALVAKFGYRDESFETNYLSNRQQIYVSAINRLDIANAAVRSASVTIPIRPELRPGYPVYIESRDTFFYANSISHSFSSGGQCTTTINGIAKRTKWFPPVSSESSGLFPAIEDVKLEAPGEYPQLPLYVYAKNLEGHEDLDAGPPRMVGFPNVVLALDPAKVNYATVDVATGLLKPEEFVILALATGFLQRIPDSTNLALSNGTTAPVTMSLTQVRTTYNDAVRAAKGGEVVPENGEVFDKFLSFVERRITVDTDAALNLVNYLALVTSLKASFSPGTSLLGNYRYYSSSHPTPDHQAPQNLKLTVDEAPVLVPPDAPDANGETLMFKNVKGKGLGTFTGKPSRGIRVKVLSSKVAGKAVPPKDRTVLTGDIRFVTMASHQQYRSIQVSRVATDLSSWGNLELPAKSTQEAFIYLLVSRAAPTPGSPIPSRFIEEYERIYGLIETFEKNSGVLSASLDVALANFGIYELKPEWGEDGPLTTAEFDQTKSDEEVMKGQATELAANLYGAVAAVIDAIKVEKVEAQGAETKTKKEGGGTIGTANTTEAYLEQMGYRADFIEGYTDADVDVPDAENGVVIVPLTLESPLPKEHFTPVFPISDSEGFEVYGNLPYGRGMNVEKYAELLQATKSTTGATFLEKAEASRTTVGSLTTASSNMDAVADFYLAWEMKNIGLLPKSTIQSIATSGSKSDQAALAAAHNVAKAEDITEGVLEAIKEQSKSKSVFIRNRPVTSFFRGQSFSMSSASKNLANLSVGDGEGCICKGASQEFFLMAFSEQYVDLYGAENAVEGFQAENTYVSGENWKYTKDALAGRVLDLRTENMAAAIKKGVDGLPENLLPDGTAALTRDLSELADPTREGRDSAFEQAVEDLRAQEAAIMEGLVYDPETDTYIDPETGEEYTRS
jgi:hypothetical protein